MAVQAPLAAAWTEEGRRHAWRNFCETPVPPKGTETWRRMEFGAWRLDGLRPADAPSASGVSPAAAAAAARSGAQLLSLEEAAARLPDLVEPYLKDPAASADFRKLEWANLALWRGGAFLRIPRGVKLAEPIELGFAHDAPYFFPRVLVLAEEGSEATVVETHRAQKGQKMVSAAFSRVVAGAGAKLRYFYDQELPSDAVHFWHQRVDLAREADLEHTTVLLGGFRHKSELEVRLSGRGAKSDIRGVLLGRGEQLFDPHTAQLHEADHTLSDLLFRAALKDKARSIYTGLIRIEKEAVESDAYQSNHNLLLSGHARADTTPVLEILTDAVRCKHGATAGPLDAEELFYLASRGLPEREAARMLILGFFEPILRRVPLSGMAERLAREIEEAL